MPQKVLKVSLLIAATLGLITCAGGGSAPGSGSGGATTTTTTVNPISISLVPSRTSGVAPLAVFFDASNTTDATVTSKPFHEIEYRWSFGDTNQALAPGGTTWPYGSRATNSERNSATGPLAGHVYETPGTYTVTLTAFDGTNTTSTTTTITVTDPDTVFAGADTICVSASSLPVAGAGGCPAGADVAQQADFATVISTYARTGKRLLLKKGDTFTTGTSAQTRDTGPGIIASYGAGANPIVQATADIGLLVFSGNGTPGISDWRVMDIELDGNGNSASTGVSADGGINQLLALRVYVHHVRMAFKFDYEVLDFYNNNGFPGHTIYDETAIVDCSTNSLLGFGSGYSIYAAGSRMMILGNNLNNNADVADPANGGEHTVRLPYVNKGVVSNNTMQGQHIQKVAFALRAILHGTAGVVSENSGDTKYVVVSDNKFIGTHAAGVVAYTPQASEDARITEVITERNWFVAGGGAVDGTQQLLELLGARTQTVRNNIFDNTGGRERMPIVIGNGLNSSDEVMVYNNTFYNSDVSTNFYGIDIRPQGGVYPTNITIYNTLAYTPNDTVHYVISCNGSSNLATCIANGLVQSNNTTNVQAAGTDPLFTSVAPFTPTNAKPMAGSYAIGGGITVPVWSDFFLVSAPASRDMGAVIH